ncbi:MAG: RQC-minor-1 family DNA-binding protein [Anaerolineales bacterium]
MGKKVRRVPVQLDPGNIEQLPSEEIKAILRGADELIMRGGRTLLARVLKGSRQKRVLELGLDESPVYGYYAKYTLEQIANRIDWVILNSYMTIEYDYRLPLLVFTDKGWEVERETYARELLEGFNGLLEGSSSPYDMRYLKDRDRQMILRLLELVEESRDSRYIPLLQDWHGVDYEKVRRRIRQVIQTLS